MAERRLPMSCVRKLYALNRFSFRCGVFVNEQTAGDEPGSNGQCDGAVTVRKFPTGKWHGKTIVEMRSATDRRDYDRQSWRAGRHYGLNSGIGFGCSRGSALRVI